MASGVLGQKVITSGSSGTDLVVYTVPSSTLAVVNINIVSISASTQTFDLAIPNETDGTFDSLDLLEDDTSLAEAGVVERTNVVLEAGRSVVVTSSDGTGVAVNVYGIEESTS
tara:strand:+ start:360 stop:698 length:339 start_codon:yes stop_codon:yes gene_type:complete